MTYGAESAAVVQLGMVEMVPAGGTDSRAGFSTPKQLLRGASRLVIEHAFGINASSCMDEIIIGMMTPGHLDAVRDLPPSGERTKVTRPGLRHPVARGTGASVGRRRRASRAVAGAGVAFGGMPAARAGRRAWRAA